MARWALAIIAFLMISVVGFFALDAGISEAEHQENITGEEFTPTVGIVELENSNLDQVDYDDNVTVYDKNDQEMTNGTDYEWHPNNGTVEVLSGGGLENDDNASIDYGWFGLDKEQQRVRSISTDSTVVLSALAMVAVAVLGVFTVVTLRGVA